MPTIELNPRELGTVLAALRYWQRMGLASSFCPEDDIATGAGNLDPLDADEIDELCERINVKD